MNLHAHRLLRHTLPAFLALSSLLVVHIASAAPRKTEADTAAHTKAGAKAPAVSVQKISGDTFSSAGNEGKVQVINFWATWCGPARSKCLCCKSRSGKSTAPLPILL